MQAQEQEHCAYMHTLAYMGPARLVRPLRILANVSDSKPVRVFPAAQAHIVRAMLEAMCFQTREVVDAMCHDAGLERLEVRREPTDSV